MKTKWKRQDAIIAKNIKQAKSRLLSKSFYKKGEFKLKRQLPSKKLAAEKKRKGNLYYIYKRR